MIPCARCGNPLDVLDAHDDPDTGEGVCDGCCATCHPHLGASA